MKKLAYLLILVPLFAGGWIIEDRATFRRDAWLADFEQLKQATEQSYANLKWSREAKQVDLVAINATALDEINAAKTNSAARRAIAKFIAGFQDNHFHIESGPPAPVAAVMNLLADDVAPEIDFTMDAATACSELGFSRKDHELTIDGARPLASATFAAGTVRTPRGRIFGVIRIPLFRQHEYGGVCERMWMSYRSARGTSCAADCQDEFNGLVKHALAQALADDASALRRAGAEAVVIDLTDNGGGTEWAEFAASALSSQPLTLPAVAFIRGPHWERSFTAGIANLDAHLKAHPDDERRPMIDRARADAVAMRDSARTSCELPDIWTDRTARPTCWNVVNARPDVMPREDLQFDRPFGGPLFIMTNQRTASASEQFAATLRDNGVARTIGRETMGVGCGFTNGGNPVTLKHSKLVIRMPDCARLRADGSNEYVGVQPDFLADWGANQASKTAALLSVLDKLPKR